MGIKLKSAKTQSGIVTPRLKSAKTLLANPTKFCKTAHRYNFPCT